MILEIFIKSLSEYEKEHLLSLLKNDKRIREEELRKLIYVNQTTIDTWSNFKINTKIRDIISKYFAEKDICVSEEMLNSLDGYELGRIRNIGNKSIIEFEKLKKNDN